MSTVFIAVQCYQCSTMQVKQQKKSSNKWTCVVCNQKQSMRKVFAQGFMARDVRKFVQGFNMSRQFEEQQHAHETLVPLPEDTNNKTPSNHKKRTDWSEYVDPEDNNFEDEQEHVFEPRIVTELPNALFKRPKLNTDLSRLVTEDGGKGFRPDFSTRNSSKAEGSSKWSDHTIQEKNQDIADNVPWRCRPRTSKEASKWDSYIPKDDDDDDNLQLKTGGEFADLTGPCDDHVFGTMLYDESVEEDIHPDFR